MPENAIRFQKLLWWLHTIERSVLVIQDTASSDKPALT